VRTRRSLARVRLAACAAACLAALALTASAPAHATQQAGKLLQAVKQAITSPPVTATLERGKTPQSPVICSSKPSAKPVAYYTQNALTSVLVQFSDEPSCDAVMTALSEDANVVAPNGLGTHNVGKGACTECASLPVYGSWLCTSGLACAGKYAIPWTETWTSPPGYIFTSWAAICTPSDGNVVLTCADTIPFTVVPYLPCSPIADSSNVHISSTPPAAASGHGWWMINNCAQVKASLTIQLQEYFSNGKWYNIGSPGSGKYYGGTTGSPGSSNQVSTRVLCSNTNQAGWRSVVTVKLPVQPGSDTYTRPGANINCTVPLPGSARPATVP
jgi:hypothetical protein